MAIPPRYLEGFYCRGGDAYTDPEQQVRHKGHKDARTCYLATWEEPPMRWVKIDRPPSTRAWHLVVGIRRDTGEAQMECNIGHGRGPFLWREKPILDWRKEGGAREWFCQRCIAAWTKEVAEVTVRMQGVTLLRKQLVRLLEEMPPTDFARVEFRPTSVDDTPALVASWQTGDRDETVVKYLLVSDGLVKLGYASPDQTPD